MTIEELLEKCINRDLQELTISGQKQKDPALPVRIKVRPVALKDGLYFQAAELIGTKVFHTNYDKEAIKQQIVTWLLTAYKQAQFVLTDADAQVLSGKKGHMTIHYKKTAKQRVQKELSHNRQKSYILKEGTPVGFMTDLGVMTKEGKVIRQKYDKFRQINRFLEFIEDILPQLDKTREQTVIDFGCGKSYLTFALYYYLKELKGYDIRVIGLDLKADVIETCNRLKDRYRYEKLDFYVGDIASYQDVTHVDLVVTLHACDTATDYALAKAVGWGAKVILSVPCCQHEANSMLSSSLLNPVLSYGILKERMAAVLTDGIRAGLLEEAGYQTQILEFIDMAHTPKNLLIRAVYTGRPNAAAGDSVRAMEQALNLDLTLNKLMERKNQSHEEQ